MIVVYIQIWKFLSLVYLYVSMDNFKNNIPATFLPGLYMAKMDLILAVDEYDLNVYCICFFI